jgi:tetratricopeptide (TPR) repeat protein
MAALLYETIGDINGAMAGYQKLSELDPNNPWSYAKIAQLKVLQAYQAQDKETKDKLVEEALNGYAKALELKPDWAEAYYYRAVLYQAIEKPIEATQDLVLAVNNSGGAVNYVLPLAQLLNERAKKETDLTTNLRTQAQQLVEGVLATDDSNVNALYVLAMIYRDSGQTDLARETVNNLLSKAQETDKPVIEQQFADLLAQ